MAVRTSLGASRVRLVRQALTESLVLSAVGGLLGVALAYFGADALVRIITSGRIMGLPQRIEIQWQPDLRVLLFTVSVSLLTGVLFGLAPVLNAFASTPASSLRGVGAATETTSRRLVGKSLVVAQVALSVVLLSAAAVFIGHVSSLRNLDLGFRRDSLLLVTLDPRGSGYNRFQLTSLYQELLARMESIPGVRSATVSWVTPIEGGAASRFANVEGFEERAEDRRYLMMNGVAPKYFETLGTRWVAGRDFQFRTTPAARASRSSIRRWRGTTSATAVRSASTSRSSATTSRTRSSAWRPMRNM